MTRVLSRPQGVHYGYYCANGVSLGIFSGIAGVRKECSAVPHPLPQRMYLRTGPVFLIFFLVPFKTNRKMWASKNTELGSFLFC